MLSTLDTQNLGQLIGLVINGTLISQLEVINLVSMEGIDIQRSKITIIDLSLLIELELVRCDNT